MYKNLHVAAVWIVTLASTGTSALSAGSFDMRQCPLDRITYFDSWTETRFEVEVVREDKSYLCESGSIKNPSNKAACKGPYGVTILQGKITDNGHTPKTQRVAFAYDIMPAAPCCGWSAYLASDKLYSSNVASIPRLKKHQIPTLGEFRVKTIEFNEYIGKPDGMTSINSLVPLVCR